MKREAQNIVRALRLNQRLVLPVIVIAALAAISLYTWRSLESDTVTTPLPAYWPTAEWRSTSPEAAGFDSVKLANSLQAIKQNSFNVHSLVLVRNGEVFLEAYFYPYDGSTYHDVASVTKSVMTTLIGIAVDQGKIDLDETMLSFFPDQSVANLDARKEQITVRHLVSMTSGFSCTARPSETTLEEMMASPDWVQFALDRPMAAEPGTRFVYDSPGMHLLSAILQRATGMTALEFARENLFEPLGITDVHWVADPQGYYRGSGALSLHPMDSAKLGLLFLQKGRWEERQIVSSDWVSEATTQHAETGIDYGEDYGYGWWVSREELVYFSADGSGGQRILAVPPMNLVLVSAGGGFDQDEVTSYIEASIVDLQKPLPENAVGAAELEAALAECRQPPAAKPMSQLPDTASSISGKSFAFEENPARLRSIRLDFDDSAVATLYIDLSDASPVVARVGLDGVYRPSISGRPCIAKGAWTDAQTFTAEYYEGPGISYNRLVMRFDDDRLTFEIVGLGSLEGRQVQP
jgi:CubicO group peptidase (beta-lactamase class C family)